MVVAKQNEHGATLEAFDIVSSETIELAIGDGRVAELVLANDASERSVRDLLKLAEDRPVTRLPVDRDTLGIRVGQPPRAALGIVPVPAFAHLRTQLRRLRSLG